MDTITFNGIFWISITANIITLIISLVKICSKSRCSEVQLCGCFKIIRDTALEEKEVEFEITNVKNQSTNNEEKI